MMYFFSLNIKFFDKNDQNIKNLIDEWIQIKLCYIKRVKRLEQRSHDFMYFCNKCIFLHLCVTDTHVNVE